MATHHTLTTRCDVIPSAAAVRSLFLRPHVCPLRGHDGTEFGRKSWRSLSVAMDEMVSPMRMRIRYSARVLSHTASALRASSRAFRAFA